MSTVFKIISNAPASRQEAASAAKQANEKALAILRSISPDCGKFLSPEKLQAIRQKFGEESVSAHWNALAEATAYNTRLSEKAVLEPEKFLSWLEESKQPAAIEARGIRWANQYLVRVKEKLPIAGSELVEGFQPQHMGLNPWQWCNAAEASLAINDALAAIYLHELIVKHANYRIDWIPFAELAAKDPVMASNHALLETEEARKWLSDEIKKMNNAVVYAKDVEGLDKFINLTAAKNLAFQVNQGEGFWTTPTEVSVPERISMFDSKQKNRMLYITSGLHESGHHAFNSFIIDLAFAELGVLGAQRLETDKPQIRLSNGETIEVNGVSDLFKAFVKNPFLGQWLHNVIDDARVDKANVEKWTGYADDYIQGNLDLLQKRPDYSGKEIADILEAFLQLMITGKTAKAIPPAIQPRVEKLVETARKELEKGKDREDGTASFNAALKVFKQLEDLVPEPQIIKVSQSDLPDSFRPARPGDKTTWDATKIVVIESETPSQKKQRQAKAGKPGGKNEAENRGSVPKDGLPSSFDIDWKKHPTVTEGLAKEGEFTYQEWNYQLRKYRENFTRVVECPLECGERLAIPVETVRKVQRIFEQLKPQETVVRVGTADGELNSELLLDYWLRRKMGESPEPRYFEQVRHEKRSVAIQVLIDASGSNSEQIGGVKALDISKIAGRLLSIAAERVGDPVAVHAFQSFGASETRFYTLQAFQDRWKDCMLEPDGANRDGAALRHAGSKLMQRPERTKILFYVSDVKPNDDGSEYTDRYGVEDTAKAVAELRAQGIIVIGLVTRDDDAEYLRHIFGKHGYSLNPDPRRLDEKLLALYGKLAF